MAKLSGFFMSTLLIVLCLWINVCHYPDAPRGGAPNASPPSSPDVVSPPDAPVSPPVEEKADEPTPSQGGLLADVGPAPELLSVSADPATQAPALEPATFPGDGAEIDDAPRSKGAAPRPSTTTNDSSSRAVPQAEPAPVAPSPASQTASPAVATPTQDPRLSGTKPRGAKYVRVPSVEIDAFSGGVRSERSSNDDSRVVGATRAGQKSRNAISPVPAP